MEGFKIILNIIIFSKDRACQLELLLRSLELFFQNWQSYSVNIIYAYSNNDYKQGYELVKQQHPTFNYLPELEEDIESFKNKVVVCSKSSHPYTMFLVDDLVFKSPVDLKDATFQHFVDNLDILCLSLRLSPQIKYCYVTNTFSPPPCFDENLVWNWQIQSKNTDWGYPMSLDGHIFRTSEIHDLILNLSFANPNELEANLANQPLSSHQMICYSESKVVNVPANKVQTIFDNRHAQMSNVNELNQQFLAGNKLSLKPILNTRNISVHQEIPLHFLPCQQRNIKASVILFCKNNTSQIIYQVESLIDQTIHPIEIIFVCHEKNLITTKTFETIKRLYSNTKISISDSENIDEIVKKNDQVVILDIDKSISSTFIEDYLNNECVIDSFFETIQSLKHQQEQLVSNLIQVESQFRFQLEFSNPQLHQTQSQLHQTQSQLHQTQSQLHQTQSQLHNELDAIKSSKFWKLRQKWFEFRKLIGLSNDQLSLNPKILIKTLIKRIDSQFNKPTIKVFTQELWDDKPLVSVIIPCFNYGEYVEDAINSILGQTFQDFEIIVVDGGSTDESTISILKSLQKAKTTIYYREGRHLVGDNRNFGIEKSCGKYICCLDADDKLKPTYLEKALFLLEVHKYDIVSTSVQCFGNSKETWHPNKFPTLKTIVETNLIPTIAVFSRQLWKKANGYHDYGIGKEHVAEDWDLWVRIMALGARVINISETLMLYRIHGTHTSLSRHSESMSWDEQSKVIKNFNQKYLTRQAYSSSRKNNRTSYKVVNGNINLINSYLKQPKKKDKLKILFALPFVITGGADTVLLQIAKHLSENDFDISILTTIKTDKQFGDNTSKYEKITQEIYPLYSFLDNQGDWKNFIYYYLESRQIDILFVVGSSYFYEILPDIKKYFPRIKVVDQLFNEYGHINNNRKYSNFIDMNILASQTIENILRQKYQEIEEKTRVILHGVDTQEEFNPINIDLRGIESIVPKDKFIVSYMGRFSEEKCPQTFVDIADKLRDYKDIYFLMLGNGSEYNSVKLKIEKLGLHEKIYSPGFVEDNRPFLKASDLLIIPSKIEGIPIVLMESLSLGIPVIASSIGGIPDIIENNYNGFLCDPNNIDDFADRIIQVYLDKKLQNQLGLNARDYAKISLDISKMNSEYLNTFISLVNSNT
jgi:glycosyltransferase involved in cell wall biosynthesis